ncbi:MAG: sugar ABC transporter ATP-binding protein [Cohaesibacter sp.]|nr:sugar ABC transporter ATP-binding protein [Cohaesibacter sp.]
MSMLQARKISKRFGNFEALKALDFTLQAGEVRAVIGSNGAGKTTMIKILTGAHAPTTGEVIVDGERLGGGPAGHIEGGIACIYQHSSLSPNLSVAENLFLGHHPRGPFGLIDRKAMMAKAQALISANATQISPHALVGSLPTVKQKEVEILKALALDARVILMDEPTAWLSFPEVERLHDTIRRLSARGVAVVYISHIMNEIFRVCETATILRDGALVWEGAVADTDRAQVVGHMLGPGQADTERLSAKCEIGDEILATKGLRRNGAFEDINLTLRKGEILCLTGLIGSKRTEVVRCLFGADQPDGGTITLRGKTVKLASPRQAIEQGIALVPEDRRAEGLFLSHTITDNVLAAALPKFLRHILLRKPAMKKTVDATIKRLNIQPPDPEKIVGTLSGGNQQKVLLGKWLETDPDIVILDEPTVGVDVGAKNDIYRVMHELKARGVAILVVSSDVEEVQLIADRIVIMSDGRIVRELDAAHVSHEELVAEISGATAA